LGIACALFRKQANHLNRSYNMSLETDRTTRDYLYGRLLAIADHLESRALYVADEKRDTNASRLMHRFADRPFATWPVIYKALDSYKSRLRVRQPGFLHNMEKLLTEVHGLFPSPEVFEDDSKLSGEFLLGYHCQRQDLWTKRPKNGDAENTDEPGTEESQS
jgi:CRISPR-associated protein Csd1